MLVSKSALSVCCCLLLGATAVAQITIAEGDIPNAIGDSFTYKVTLSEANVSVGSAGGPHVWTFDTTFAGAFTGMELVDKANTPRGSMFPDANVAIEQVYGPYGMWIYRKLDVDRMLDLGMAMTNAAETLCFRYDPAGVNLDLPLTFGTQWQTTFGYTDSATQIVVLNIYDCSIDAWGTATCPGGTYPCLRENVFQTEITTIPLPGAATSAETVLTRRYYWLAAKVGAVAMAHSMEGDTSSNFTLADDYNVFVWGNTGGVAEQRGLPPASAARILPNPCAGSAELRLAAGTRGPVTVRVCDATGRVVLSRTLSVGPQASSVPLDLRGNRSGLYICTVNAGGRTLTNELVLLK